MDGHDEIAIRDALKQLHPDIDQDAALNEAVAELKEDGKVDPDVIRGWALRAFRDLYRRQLEIGDFDGCRKSMREILNLIR